LSPEEKEGEDEEEMMTTPDDSVYGADYVNVIQQTDEGLNSSIFGPASYLSPQPSLTNLNALCSAPTKAVLLKLEEIIFPHSGNFCKIYMR
jgi:hypothetical protein